MVFWGPNRSHPEVPQFPAIVEARARAREVFVLATGDLWSGPARRCENWGNLEKKMHKKWFLGKKKFVGEKLKNNGPGFF